jgi:hypothetical protein
MTNKEYVAQIEVWSDPDPDRADDLLDALLALGAIGPVVASGSLGVGYTARFFVEIPGGGDEGDLLAAHEARMIVMAALEKAGVEHRGVARLEVIDGNLDELEFTRETDELVGVTELAEMLGVTRQRASELRTRPGFPAPIADLASGPVWKSSSLRRFVDTWERRPGRPRKASV